VCSSDLCGLAEDLLPQYVTNEYLARLGCRRWAGTQASPAQALLRPTSPCGVLHVPMLPSISQGRNSNVGSKNIPQSHSARRSIPVPRAVLHTSTALGIEGRKKTGLGRMRRMSFLWPGLGPEEGFPFQWTPPLHPGALSPLAWPLPPWLLRERLAVQQRVQ